MQEYIIQVRRTLLQMGLLVVLLAVGAVGTGHTLVVPGLLLGTLGSSVYFLLMCFRVKRSATLSPEAAVVYMRSGWFIRLFFIVLILILSLHISQINFIAAVVGLFSLHLVLVLNAILVITKSLFNKQGNTH